jgi:hypothetical protein
VAVAMAVANVDLLPLNLEKVEKETVILVETM